MIFKGNWPREINRLGSRFIADSKWNLEIDIDNLTKKVLEIDEEGNEIQVRERITEDEKNELLSALKCYGFSQVVEAKAKKTKEVETEALAEVETETK